MAEKKQRIMVNEGASGIRTAEVDFPPNSHKIRKKEAEDAPKVLNKIISGTVVQKKKSFFKKISESFLGDDVNSVSSYIIHDVIIPATKSTISDMVSGGIEMLLFGETRGSRTRRDKGKSYVSYSNYYNSKSDRADRERKGERREPSTRNSSRHNFDDIILDTRGEAEEVLSTLVDLIDDYGVASVADLYSLLGIASNFTDNKYGWSNLSIANVNRVRDGYLINLPKTELID